MDELNEKWAVTYQFHDMDERFHVMTAIVDADCIGNAISQVDDSLCREMDALYWSDYHITSAFIIPELH